MKIQILKNGEVINTMSELDFARSLNDDLYTDWVSDEKTIEELVQIQNQNWECGNRKDLEARVSE